MNLASFSGLLALLVFAWLLSSNRREVNWRLLGWGVGLQLLVGFLVFRMGTGLFTRVNAAFVAVVEAASEGPRFLFGPLALGPGQEDPLIGNSIGFVLATQALPLIVVFSGLLAVLYHWGLMQHLIRGFAWLFNRLLRTSGAESLCAASNIFVGIESALVVKPYLQRMTRSELCTVLTAGMATVASNVIGAYYFMLHQQFPNIMGHLVSASIISAPAALVLAKLLLPEEELPETLGRKVEPFHEQEDSLFEAVIAGANNGLKLVAGIVALLLAVVGMVHVANLFLGVSSMLGLPAFSLEGVLGILFRPLVLLMGISWAESGVVAEIVGQRLVLTEFASYGALAQALADSSISPRAAVITAYALCGFAHVPSMAIFVGGISALVPERRADLARVAPRALLAANLACLMTGCVAGMFFSGSSLILP